MPSSPPVFSTPLTKLFRINHPVMLAGESHMSLASTFSVQSTPIHVLRYERCGWAPTCCCSYECRYVPEMQGRISYCMDTHTLTTQGGIGVIGGVRQSPKILEDNINELKSHLEDPNAPFGVDLLIPQVGGNARKTNVGGLQMIMLCVCTHPAHLYHSMITRRVSSRRLPTS